MTLLFIAILYNNQQQGVGYSISNANSYLRGGPSSETYATGVISKGDTVLVLEPIDSLWVKIEYDNTTGYALRKFLDEIQIDSTRLSKAQKPPQHFKEETNLSDSYIGISVISLVLVLVIYLLARLGHKKRAKSKAPYFKQDRRAKTSFETSTIKSQPTAHSYQEEKSSDKTSNNHKEKSAVNDQNLSIPVSDVSSYKDNSILEVENDNIVNVKEEEINLNIELEEFEEVPYWPHQYVYSYEAINSASNSHRKFYERYKSNFHNGNLLDIRGNTNYAFVLYFDLLREFKKHQDIQKLEKQLLFLGKSCPKTKSYSLYALIDILRSKSDYNSLELLKKLEDPTYQYEAGYSDYDPNAYKLGTQYKSKLDLNKNEVELLNKFYNPSNVFNSVEGCCVAIIEQYLKIISAVENDLLGRSSSLIKEISQLQILVKEHFDVGDNFYELRYINERVESETFLTIFKRVENSVRTAFDHKRKISDVFPYSENKLNEEFEERIGRILDKEITVQQPNIKNPDVRTQIQLNSQNVNRWKSEFDVLKEALKNEKLEKFYDGIDRLEEVNQKNSNIEHIFYEASKTIAKYNKTQALKYYAKYISYDLNSDKIHNKQLTKTVQKSLFNSENQLVRFRQIIQELFNNNNLEQVLSKLDDFYKPVRKRIVLNKNEIREAENKHSTTVDILNKYLVNDEVGKKEKVNLPDSEEELSISFNPNGSNQSKFIDNLRLNKTQEELLLTIAQNEFSIFQQEVEKMALKNGILKNQLIDSINEVCFDFLEGEVLIEEDQEYYIIEKSYYQEILKE